MLPEPRAWDYPEEAGTTQASGESWHQPREAAAARDTSPGQRERERKKYPDFPSPPLSALPPEPPIGRAESELADMLPENVSLEGSGPLNTELGKEGWGVDLRSNRPRTSAPP